jgi:hypothetical protein
VCVCFRLSISLPLCHCLLCPRFRASACVGSCVFLLLLLLLAVGCPRLRQGLLPPLLILSTNYFNISLFRSPRPLPLSCVLSWYHFSGTFLTHLYTYRFDVFFSLGNIKKKIEKQSIQPNHPFTPSAAGVEGRKEATLLLLLLLFLFLLLLLLSVSSPPPSFPPSSGASPPYM